MELQVDKINRQVDFPHAPPVDYGDSSGKNNNWIYNRAPDGYKFVLHSVNISVAHNPYTSTGIFAIYDGHEYTHWNQFPGVVSHEVLARCETGSDGTQFILPLNGWECKEYTIGTRSLSESIAYKVCVIVWYYLRKMTWLEKVQYAVSQPRGQRFRKGSARTAELTEISDS